MNSELRIISEPVTEETTLAVTSPEASADEIVEAMEVRAEYCVDHLCGCM